MPLYFNLDYRQEIHIKKYNLLKKISHEKRKLYDKNKSVCNDGHCNPHPIVGM